MDKIKKSEIQIVEFELERIEFKKKSKELRQRAVSFRAVEITASVLKMTDVKRLTKCTIEIGKQDNDAQPFYCLVEYNICTTVTSSDKLTDLDNFAKVGAPYNAMVHARELLASLTAKAFGRVLLLPLIDIREFLKVIKISEQEVPKADGESEQRRDAE